MKKNITSQIRTSFVNYFKKQDHVIVPPSSLIPKNDPTLMFTNSGMVQFKNYLAGTEKTPFPRAATVQKSVRAGGKHNDLDNVGYTKRHHTFFEMLGNFSFGDYFKEKAITYAWEFLTKEIKIDKSRLCVTVYHTDDEARTLWKKIAGLSDNDIIPIATNDNFWQMGDTGPCGPCSEIFYDHGDKYWGGRPGTPEEDGDRFIEVWNLVFDQYEDLPDGNRIETPNKSIDTGAGIERLSAVLHGTNDNYEIDIFRELIRNASDILGTKETSENSASFRVIADHLRATSFLLADGVMPSNEGRGYVLRRIMRRAMRHAHLLGAKDPLMHQLVPSLIDTMGETYPELGQHEKLITESLQLEEERFKQTLDNGLKLLADETTNLKSGDRLSGDVAFKLYDTYGFPLDLTADALRAKEITVDEDGFNAAMEKQRAEARKSWTGSGNAADERVWFQIKEQTGDTEFLGYDTDTSKAQVIALIQNGTIVNSAGAGETVSIVTNQTPFYGEMGGQVGDTGIIENDNVRIQVTDTLRKADTSLIVHQGLIERGTISVGDNVQLKIDVSRRFNIRGHHSATHLLQSALQTVLGPSVHQRGSQVTPTGFRFDFTYNKAMTPDELRQVETAVNEMILKNVPAVTELKSPEQAMADGAMALFDEKYGETVRVVSLGTGDNRLSCELCGGTHVSATGDIGMFRIVSESGVSAGVRRIEAMVGLAALCQAQETDGIITDLMCLVRATSTDEMKSKIATAIADKKKLEKELSDLRKQIAVGGTQKSDETETINGIKFIGKVLKNTPAKELKPMADEFKKQIGSGVIALLSSFDDKVSIVVGVTSDLTKEISAVDLVKIGAKVVGGQGGGGRSDMAQAGGTDVAQMDTALEKIKQRI